MRLKLLSAWRYLHLLRNHSTVRRYARKAGVSCSSNIGLRRMLKLGNKFQRPTRAKR
jgi:hypothetical protein